MIFREEGHPGCSACRTVEVEGGWQSLELVTTLDAGELFSSSPAWAGRKIEVRECPLCGRSIARAAPHAGLH